MNVGDEILMFLRCHGVAETLKRYSEDQIREVAQRHNLWLPKYRLSESIEDRKQREHEEQHLRTLRTQAIREQLKLERAHERVEQKKRKAKEEAEEDWRTRKVKLAAEERKFVGRRRAYWQSCDAVCREALFWARRPEWFEVPLAPMMTITDTVESLAEPFNGLLSDSVTVNSLDRTLSELDDDWRRSLIEGI